MMCAGKSAEERSRRFRDTALPCLDDAYRLAYFLMRNRTDAEDAVQECYLRALRHFDGWQGSEIKPWLLAILRNVCHTELARRGRQQIAVDPDDREHPVEQPLWQEPPQLPDAKLLEREEGDLVRQLIAALPAQFQEAIVLREFKQMSYREIADAAGVPIGTVMSRLARARALLLAAWTARNNHWQKRPGPTPQAQMRGLSIISHTNS